MRNREHAQNKEESINNIEVWEDLVSIRDLVLSLFITSITTMGGYFLAHNDPPQPLFFGLLGAFFGFILTSFIIKPKRILQEVESEE